MRRCVRRQAFLVKAFVKGLTTRTRGGRPRRHAIFTMLPDGFPLIALVFARTH